jgi:small neutral amino acid transporter SnatA (MarC family)
MKKAKGMNMKKTESLPKKSVSFISGWVDKAWKLGLQPLLETFLRQMEDRVEAWERRALALAAAYLGIFAGSFFFVLGVFFLLVDYCGLPRGVVFTAGGFLIVLISFVYLQGGKRR